MITHTFSPFKRQRIPLQPKKYRIEQMKDLLWRNASPLPDLLFLECLIAFKHQSMR